VFLSKIESWRVPLPNYPHSWHEWNFLRFQIRLMAEATAQVFYQFLINIAGKWFHFLLYQAFSTDIQDGFYIVTVAALLPKLLLITLGNICHNS